MNNCGICNTQNEFIHFEVKEMMYGLNEKFNYFECSNCGCLQLLNIPNDYSKYYSGNYYSFQNKNTNIFKKLLKKYRGLESLKIKSSVLGKIGVRIFGEPDYAFWFNKMEVKLTNKILDIGCGNGQLLKELKNVGFKNLYGLDPNINKNIFEENLIIYKDNIENLSEKYDFILFNHSFEHFINQFEVLIKIKKHLNSNGKILIRIPIAAYAWKKYGVNWASLDAPRHLFLHTVKSFKILAAKTGYKIDFYQFDSTNFQIWASEQYQLDIPLYSEKSYRINPSKSIFKENKIKEMNKLVQELNYNESGDQAGFILSIIDV